MVLLVRPDRRAFEDQRDITAAAAVAALGVAVAAASAASQLSPFEPPHKEERTSAPGDCGRENVKPFTLRVCHHHRTRRRAPEGSARGSGPRRDRCRCNIASATARKGKGPSIGGWGGRPCVLNAFGGGNSPS
jgi:hypothetical protein